MQAVATIPPLAERKYRCATPPSFSQSTVPETRHRQSRGTAAHLSIEDVAEGVLKPRLLLLQARYLFIQGALRSDGKGQEFLQDKKY